MIKGLRNPERVPSYVTNKTKEYLLDLYYDYDSNQTNVYDKDWDLLIVLDGCRVDSIEELSSEYDFLPRSVPHITSTGGGSPQWLANTFTDERIKEISQTAYITGNPHVRRVLGPEVSGLFADRGGPEDRLSDFDHFLPVWETHWDNSLGTVPARAITDLLIQYYRSEPCSRTIVHYMQPHFPSVPKPIGDGMNINDEAKWDSEDAWSLVRENRVSVKEVYRSYINNLRYVLDDVELLLSNVDAKKVIITADHGNAFGEWGEYGHGQSYIGKVRRVPWIETTARDTNDYVPDKEQTTIENPRSINDKLRALGYKT